MKVLPWLLSAGLAVAAVVALVTQQQTNETLRAEIAQVRDQVRQLTVTQAEAAKGARTQISATDAKATSVTDSDHAELVKLRQQIATLQKTTQEIAQAAQSAQKAATSGHASDAAPVRLIPASAWKNAGRGTPAAAIETALWAASGGDTATVADSIALTASAREKANALFATLSDQTRAQYGTPENLLALMIAKDAASVTGLQVLGQREISADDVGVRVRFGNDEGKTKEQSFLLHRADDGYRLMLTDDAVDKYAKQIGGGK